MNIYKITTIRELFNIINQSNVDRFIADINGTIRHISKIKDRGIDIIVNEIEWKDDGDIRSNVFPTVAICVCTLPEINPWGDCGTILSTPQLCLKCKNIVINKL